MKTQISKHFTLEEMVRSEAAARLNIDNTPPPAAVANITLLCLNILDPIVTLVNEPIFITSGFRCYAVNTAIHGSKSSQHMAGTIDGDHEAAADIDAKGLTVEELFQKIKASRINFDQLIQEFNQWVHVSWSNKPRRQCLKAVHTATGTEYLPY